MKNKSKKSAIQLIQNSVIINVNEQIAEAFNNYFINIIQSISDSFLNNLDDVSHDFNNIVNTNKSYDEFNICAVNIQLIMKLMNILERTSCGTNGISSKLIFLCKDIFASFLLQVINLSFYTNTFPA